MFYVHERLRYNCMYAMFKLCFQFQGLCKKDRTKGAALQYNRYNMSFCIVVNVIVIVIGIYIYNIYIYIYIIYI